MKCLFKTLLFALAVLLAPAAAVAVPLGYFSQAVPDGISSGWTYPDGMRSSLGDAVLIGQSDVYALHYSPAGRDSLALLDSYLQPVRVFGGDVDGDGLADLIVAFSQSQAIRMIVGRDDERTVTDLLTGGTTILSAGAALINSDSLPDLVLADSDSIRIYSRVSPDSSTGLKFRFFAGLKINPTAGGHPLTSQSMLFGDYNGDLQIDMVYKGSVYLNRGKGKFYSQQLPVPQGLKVKLLDVSADFDGDRRSELLWTSSTGEFEPVTVSVADYNSAEIFRESIRLETGLLDISKAFRYDADGDGRLELAFYSLPDKRAVEFPGSPNGVVTAGRRELFALSAPRGNLLGPLSLAGTSEAGWMFHDVAGDLIHVGFALRPYADATAISGLADTLAGVAVAVGDYNQDGRQDIYVVNADGANALYRAEPGGTFTEVAAQAGVSQGNDGISCAWGDYNNDGYPDLFVAGLFLPDKLFFNRGDGTFADSSQVLQFSRGNLRATSVSWGDVNHDGYLDLLITSFDNANWLLINRGGRYFDDLSGSLGPAGNDYHTENASLVDVDRDGWLDIVLLNFDGPARLLMGGPGGQWTDVTTTSGLNSSPQYSKFGQSQSWGDFNGDGYPDLFITRAADNSELLLNNGAGAQTRFNPVYRDKPAGGTFGRLGSAIDDFDSDGHADLLITRTELYGTNSEIAVNLVYLGDARGYPLLEGGESSSVPRPGESLVAPLRFNSSTSLPVSGDFDGDGDIDILYVNYLPENPNDFFHGSSLPLLLMSNASSFSNTLTVILHSTDKKNIAGTSVVLFHGGRAHWKAVSGGGGRIQAGPYLTFSLGSSANADSMYICWPNGTKKTILGPLYPGKVELETDLTPPQLAFEVWPGDLEGGGTITSSPLPLNGVLQVVENSQLSRLNFIIRTPATGRQDTLRLANNVSGGRVAITFDPPLPGDSLAYYCVATDIYNNSSRLPAGQNTYYHLKAEAGVLKGDLNGDLKININDVITLLSIMKDKQNPPTDRELKAGDLNFDGKLDIFDVTSLLSLLKQPNPDTNVQASFD